MTSSLHESLNAQHREAMGARSRTSEQVYSSSDGRRTILSPTLAPISSISLTTANTPVISTPLSTIMEGARKGTGVMAMMKCSTKGMAP